MREWRDAWGLEMSEKGPRPSGDQRLGGAGGLTHLSRDPGGKWGMHVTYTEGQVCFQGQSLLFRVVFSFPAETPSWVLEMQGEGQ